MIRGLPERLQNLRRQAGFSQRKVADHLGVSCSIISGYETGERTPSAENLLALSYLYRCSTDYLFGRDCEPAKPTLDVSGLSTRQRQLLEELVETMRK